MFLLDDKSLKMIFILITKMSCLLVHLDVYLARTVVENSHHLKPRHVVSRIQTLLDVWFVEGTRYLKGVKDVIDGLMFNVFI